MIIFVRSSVRPLTFSNDFPSEAAEPILLKFHMEPLYVGGTKALGLNLCTNRRGREIYQSCKNDGRTLTFDLFKARSSLLLYAFVWAPYICMGKNVENYKRLLF